MTNEEISLERHKANIDRARPYVRMVIFWSSISLFYIFSDIHVGTANGLGDENNGTLIWGIRIFGVTEQKFLYFLLIVNFYHGIKFAFVIIRISIISNSWVAFRSLGWKTFDRNFEGAKIEKIEDSIESNENTDPTDPERQSNENRRETLLLMIRYYIMGLVEYFVAPIILPAILILWALTVLVFEAIFRCHHATG